jgi:hypothetical protein
MVRPRGTNVTQKRAHKLGSPADQEEEPFKNFLMWTTELLTFARMILITTRYSWGASQDTKRTHPAILTSREGVHVQENAQAVFPCPLNSVENGD